MHVRGGNGFTQFSSLWHRNFVFSPARNQALLSLSQASTHSPPLSCVQGIHLLGGTSLQSFISDGVVFQNPTLQRPLRLGHTPTPWGRGGLMEQWPDASLTQKTFMRSCSGRGSDYGKSQHTSGAKFHHTLVSLSQHQQMWMLSEVCWYLCL